jgi:hypothetical protein
MGTRYPLVLQLRPIVFGLNLGRVLGVGKIEVIALEVIADPK